MFKIEGNGKKPIVLVSKCVVRRMERKNSEGVVAVELFPAVFYLLSGDAPPELIKAFEDDHYVPIEELFNVLHS